MNLDLTPTSWLTRLKARLVGRMLRFFTVSAFVGLAMMMVVPATVASDVPTPSDADVLEATIEGQVVAWQGTDLDTSTWANSSLVLAPLYLRIPEPELLNSSLRAEIFSFISQNPGATFTRVRDSVGAATGTVQHHLRVLVQADMLRKVRTGKYTRYYPFNHRVLALGPSQEAIVRSLADDGPATQADLAHRTGMTRQLVHYHIKNMESSGLVEVDRDLGTPLVRLGAPARLV